MANLAWRVLVPQRRINDTSYACSELGIWIIKLWLLPSEKYDSKSQSSGGKFIAMLWTKTPERGAGSRDCTFPEVLGKVNVNYCQQNTATTLKENLWLFGCCTSLVLHLAVNSHLISPSFSVRKTWQAQPTTVENGENWTQTSAWRRLESSCILTPFLSPGAWEALRSSTICIKKLKPDTSAPAHTHRGTARGSQAALESLLALSLCCVSRRQLLSLRWHPPTSREQGSPGCLHTFPGAISSFSFCFTVPFSKSTLKPFSTARLPQFGGSDELFSIQVSGRKYIRLDFMGSLFKKKKNAFFNVEIVPKGIEAANLAPSQENVFDWPRVLS